MTSFQHEQQVQYAIALIQGSGSQRISILAINESAIRHYIARGWSPQQIAVQWGSRMKQES